MVHSNSFHYLAKMLRVTFLQGMKRKHDSFLFTPTYLIQQRKADINKVKKVLISNLQISWKSPSVKQTLQSQFDLQKDKLAM